MRKENIKNDLKNLKIPIIIVAVYCIIMQTVFGTVCPVRALTGYYCPACGLTRAGICLLTFRFKEAMSYNPSIILWVISIFLFLFDRYIKKLKINIFPTFFIVTGIATIIIFICR